MQISHTSQRLKKKNPKNLDMGELSISNISHREASHFWIIRSEDREVKLLLQIQAEVSTGDSALSILSTICKEVSTLTVLPISADFAKVPVITKDRQYWNLNVIIFFLKQIDYCVNREKKLVCNLFSELIIDGTYYTGVCCSVVPPEDTDQTVTWAPTMCPEC